MSKPATSKEITIPAPARGMNTEDPFLDPMTGYARLIRNLHPYDGSLKKRWGTDSTTGTFGGLTVLWFDATKEYALLSDGTVRDYSLSTLYTSAITTGPVYSFAYRTDIYLFNGVNTPASYGAAFPFTPASTSFRGGCAYKNRPYFFDNTTINYPATIDAVAGALTSFDLASILNGETIIGTFQYSGTSGVNQDNLMAIFGNGGKVILYSGNSPSSTNWSLVAVFQMSPPINQKCLMQIDGDVVIATTEYMYSLSELIGQGASAVKKNAVSNRVRRAYKQFYGSDAAMAYDPTNDAVVLTSDSLTGLVITTEPPT